jgi:hypothetical protein
MLVCISSDLPFTLFSSCSCNFSYRLWLIFVSYASYSSNLVASHVLSCFVFVPSWLFVFGTGIWTQSFRLSRLTWAIPQFMFTVSVCLKSETNLDEERVLNSRSYINERIYYIRQMFVYLFIFSAGNWIQDFLHATQVLYHWAICPALRRF